MKVMIDVNIEQLDQMLQNVLKKMRSMKVDDNSLPAVLGISADTLETYLTGISQKIRIKNLYKIIMLNRIFDNMNDEGLLKYISWKLEYETNTKALKQNYFESFPNTLEANRSEELLQHLMAKKRKLFETNAELQRKIEVAETPLKFTISQYETARVKVSEYSSSELSNRLEVSRVTAGKLVKSIKEEPNDSSLTLSRISSINERL